MQRRSSKLACLCRRQWEALQQSMAHSLSACWLLPHNCSSEFETGLALTDIRARTYLNGKSTASLGLECFVADAAALLMLGPGNLLLDICQPAFLML